MSLFFSLLQNKITELKINKIITSRKSILVGIINYVQTKIDLKKDINLNFICTHNSRRSHYCQIWAQVLAEYFKIKKFKSFSGGTISTDVSENVINSLIKCGFRLNSKVKKKQTIYKLSFSNDTSEILCFSKKFNDKFNPKNNFAAIMTCSSAEKNCPFISGSDKIISIPYDDPKKFDDSRYVDQEYMKINLIIASEMYYVFSSLKV